MKTCATCKHYEPEEDGTVGRCTRICLGLDFAGVKPDALITDNGELAVTKSFGCVLHEEKTG